MRPRFSHAIVTCNTLQHERRPSESNHSKSFSLSQLEAESWLQLNGGFVGGRALDLSAEEAIERSCEPLPAQLSFEYELHRFHPANTQLPSCDDADLIDCKTLRALPFGSLPLQVILVVFTSSQAPALASFLRAAMKRKLDSPLVLAPADDAAAAIASSLESSGTVMPSKTGALRGLTLAAPKTNDVGYAFELVAELLRAGVETLWLSPRVALLRDEPFRYMHRDADIEIGSDGWDDR